MARDEKRNPPLEERDDVMIAALQRECGGRSRTASASARSTSYSMAAGSTSASSSSRRLPSPRLASAPRHADPEGGGPMAIVDVGDTYRNTFRMLVDGTLADPATVTASVTLPDGTTSSPTPTQVGPGVWEVLYTTSQAGRHTLAVTGSGGDLGTIVVKHDDVINAEATGGL